MASPRLFFALDLETVRFYFEKSSIVAAGISTLVQEVARYS